MDRNEIRRELRSSLDMEVLRRDLILVIGVDVLVLLIFAFTAGGIANRDFLLAAVLICAITIIPVAIYSIWVTVRIFCQPEGYVFGRCKLSQPHQCRLARGAMYFTIVFEDPQGNREILDTRPIFASYGIAGPLLNIPPLRSRVSGEREPPFRWFRASVPGGESRYLFRYCCASLPHALSMAAGVVSMTAMLVISLC